MDQHKRTSIQALGALCAAAVLPLPARAQRTSYPSEPVTVVVPFAAGGSTDHFARVLFKALNARLGGAFIVDNRPGAGAAIGTRAVAIAPPDGKTLLYTTATPLSVNPHIYQSLPYDPDNAFAPIALSVQLPLVVAVSSSLGVKTLDELVRHLRRNEASSSFSSYGNGTASHIAGSVFLKRIGAGRVLHVPYKDTRAIPDLAAGRNTFQIDGWSTVAALVASGKLTALAVCSTERMPWVPNVPTVASVLGQDFDLSTWHGLFAPKATPAAVLDFLNQEVKAVMADEAVRAAALQQGFIPYRHMPRREVEAFVASDRSRWKRFVETAEVERI